MYSNSSLGIALAFGLDSVSFAVSAICLWLIQIGGEHQPSSVSSAKDNLWTSIGTGVKYLWDNEVLRLMFIILAAINFLLIGPLLVGIPVLANQRLPEGAVAFGLLMSAYSGGNLIGYVMAGSLPRASGMVMRGILITLLIAFGVVIGSLAFISSTWVDFSLLFLLGLGNGYIAIILFTWIQTQTPREMLGRMMSILIFANTGLVPVSQAISGAISKWDLNLMFVSAGALVLLVTLWAVFQPQLKIFSDSLATAYSVAEKSEG